MKKNTSTFLKNAGNSLRLAAKTGLNVIFQTVHRNIKILYLAGRKFGKDYCVVRAAALAFATSLAMVPTAITFLLVAKWSGLLQLSRIADWVRTFLIKRFLPTEGAENAIEYINNLVDKYLDKVSLQISGLGIFSFGALIITTMFFLLTIEKSFNDIWAVTIKRNFLKRMRNVWVIITLGPILVFFLFFFGTRFYSNLMASLSQNSTLQTTLNFTLPFLFSVFIFYLLYQFVPYSAVHPKAALKAALFSGIIWEFIKLPFSLYCTNVLDFGSVYGQIGFIPIFLLWLYLSWVIVLLGVEISFCQQNLFIIESQDPREAKFAAGLREYFSVRVAEQVAQAFRKGESAAKVSDIARSLGIPRSFVVEIGENLKKKGILISLKEKSAYQLALSEDKITLGDIITTVAPAHLEVPEQEMSDVLDQRLRELFSIARNQIENKLYKVTLAELMKSYKRP